MGEFGRGSETSEGAQPYKAFSGGAERREQGPVEPARTDEPRSEPIGDVRTPEPLRMRIARIREQGQNAMLISADGESAEQVMIDPDKRWRYDKKHVGGKAYLTTEHAELYHPIKNPLASEIVGEEIHGPVLILKDDTLSGPTGLTDLQFAGLANEIELMEPLRISVKRIPDPSSGQEPELVFKPDLPGVIGLKRPPTRK